MMDHMKAEVINLEQFLVNSFVQVVHLHSLKFL